MIKLKKLNSFVLSSALASLPLVAQEPALNSGLLKAASKIDLGASYVELNDAKTDIDTVKKYGNLLLEGLQQIDPSTPAVDLGKLMDELGLGAINATATSNSKAGDLWLNKSYIETGGSRAGLFSMFGGDSKEFVVPSICPAGTDVALQLQLHLDQVPKVLRSVADLFDVGEEAEEGIDEMMSPLGVTGEEFFKQFQATFNLAVEFDEDFNPKFIGRIDGLSWIWTEQVEAVLEGGLEEQGVTFRKEEKDGKKIYEFTIGMDEPPFAGVNPYLVVDQAKNQIWLASSRDYFELCSKAPRKLKDDPAFVKTWSGISQKGNSMAYVSNGLLKKSLALVDMFVASEGGDVDESSFEALAMKILAEFIPEESGVALAIANDKDGILATAKIPMASKHLDWVSTQVATMLPFMYMGMKTTEMMVVPPEFHEDFGPKEVE